MSLYTARHYNDIAMTIKGAVANLEDESMSIPMTNSNKIIILDSYKVLTLEIIAGFLVDNENFAAEKFWTACGFQTPFTKDIVEIMRRGM